MWGNELNRELSLAAGIFSMTLAASQSYPSTAMSYSSAVASLSLAVSQAISQVGTGSVAVGMLSFDEAGDIFLAAKDDPVLKAVRWIGCDGNAKSAAITGDTAATGFAVQTNFLASTFLNPFDAGNPSATRSPFVSPIGTLKARIQAKLGAVPTEYAFTAYDSLWLAGLACKKLDGFPEAPKVLEAIWHAAYDFRGTSGAMRLSPRSIAPRGTMGSSECRATPGSAGPSTTIRAIAPGLPPTVFRSSPTKEGLHEAPLPDRSLAGPRRALVGGLHDARFDGPFDREQLLADIRASGCQVFRQSRRPVQPSFQGGVGCQRQLLRRRYG